MIDSLSHMPPLDPGQQELPSQIAWVHAIPGLDYGAFGVGLFFIISGFVIPISLERTNVIPFIINRFFRIYPVYLAGFAISLAALSFASYYTGKVFPYAWQSVALHMPGVRDVSWTPFMDGIIWTLEIEVKFYILCAFIAPLLRRKSLWVFAAPTLIFATAIALASLLPWLLETHIEVFKQASNFVFAAHYLIYLFVGVAFNYAYSGRIGKRANFFLVTVLFVAFTSLWASGPYAAQIPTAWTYLAALIFFTFAMAYPAFFTGNAVTKFIANISYPLYALHCIFGYVALRYLILEGVDKLTSLVIVTILAIIMAWVIHLLVETPSKKLGSQLSQLATKTTLSRRRALHVNDSPSIERVERK